jgi:vanillate monooxygenase
MTAPFLTNFWYVAFGAGELTDRPLARTVCGIAMVFFRGANGAPAALDDACPHRQAPLSLGAVHDGVLRCPYHGLKFDAAGTCVDIPTQTKIPVTAHVRAYPARERYGLIWVWPGGKDDATSAQLPPLPWREDPGWNTATVQYFAVDAPAELMADNLLDLSHVAFIHPAIAFDPERLREDPLISEVDGDVVRNSRVFAGVPPAPSHRRWHAFPGNVTRTSVSEWRPPGTVSVLVRNEDERVRLDLRYDHMMTPETPTTHHYFVALARNFAVDDAALSEALDAEALAIHGEDLAMVQAQAQNKRRLGEHREMALRQDRGLIQAHRILQRFAAQADAQHATDGEPVRYEA